MSPVSRSHHLEYLALSFVRRRGIPIADLPWAIFPDQVNGVIHSQNRINQELSHNRYVYTGIKQAETTCT
jgi:hypothetical protein